MEWEKKEKHIAQKGHSTSLQQSGDIHGVQSPGVLILPDVLLEVLGRDPHLPPAHHVQSLGWLLAYIAQVIPAST